MSEKNKKRQIAKISIFITSIFVIFISITYAFITQTLTGTKKQVINAGVLDLVLEEENAITISDALPMYDEVGMRQEDVFVFRLVNKTSNPTNYILKMSKIASANELSPSDVKYYLTKEGVGQPKLLSTLPADGTVDEGTIAGSDTLDYTLRLWIDSNVTDKTTITGKSLSYRIDVEVSQEIKKEKVMIAGQTFEIENSTSTIPDFSQISSETNGRGIYKYTEDGEDIYYWRGDVDAKEGAENHIIFGGYCWEMVRTTKTDGLKMIYDGVPVEADGKQTCPNTGTASQLASKSAFNSSAKSPAYVGYMYGNTVYEYQTKTSSDASLTTAGILYGYDVEWTGTEYELRAKDGGSLFLSTGTWSTDRTSVGNGNHYTCFDSDGKCETVSYVYYTGGSYPYYIDLSGGITIEKALEQMYSNEKPSTIKTAIETWFESTDLDEEENLGKLEDVVYCNDRSVTDVNHGWSKDGDASEYMYYSSETRLSNGTPDLSCSGAENNRDRFTYKDTVNGNGLLKWPVGLLTVDEIILAGGQDAPNIDYYLYTGKSYQALSPYNFDSNLALEFDVGSSGSFGHSSVNVSNGVRPVISLSSNATFAPGGTGTETNPYVVE